MKPLSKFIAYVHRDDRVACGCCLKICPYQALDIWKSFCVTIYPDLCVGCGERFREYPASAVDIIPHQIKASSSSDNRKGEA